MKKLFLILSLVLLLCVAFTCKQNTEKGITEEEAQAFSTRVLAMWNDHDINIADEVYAPEIVRHDCAIPEAIVGLDNVKDYLKNQFTAFPDLNLTEDEMIVAGNKGVQRWKMTGTNTGPMGNMPPTGRSVKISGVSVGHFDNGKLVEIWDFYNVLDMMQQLGFTLNPPQPPEAQEEKK